MSLADARGKLPMDKLLEMKLQADLRSPSVRLRGVHGQDRRENLRPSWLIFSEGFGKPASSEAPSARSTSCPAAALIIALP